jgi:DNA-directed RNA polymerase specialized sigma24 family protein
METETMNTSSARDYFFTTQWSLVFHAGNLQSPRAESALNELCKRYRWPLYVYACRDGTARADAEDLVQGFFLSQFLQTNFLQDLNSTKGQFRAYLLACFRNYSRNEWKQAGRQKRGGGADHLPIDWATADEKFQSQLMAGGTPERAYDRACAITLLGQVLAQLGREMQDKGKREQFEILKPCLTVDRDDLSYRAAANHLKLSEEATRAAARRLRKRYQELIRQEILETCDPAQVEEEIRSLLSAFSD